jgi:hypothetical protein
MWIDIELIERMIQWGKETRKYNRHILLYALTYTFMLRLPSEALPMILSESNAGDDQSVLSCGEDQIVLRLKRRKNRPFGGTMARTCWCAQSPSTCPVHVLGKAVSKTGANKNLFEGITACNALQTLRVILKAMRVEGADKYRTHDLRRGHARDLQRNGLRLLHMMCTRVCYVVGETMAKILEFGQWKPPAFLSYLDCELLEREAVLEVVCWLMFSESSCA